MSKPIIKAEINENTPTIGVNVPDGNVPILPVETIGGGSEPTIVSLAVTENGEYTAPEGVDGYSPILVDVDPHLTNLVATENGTYRPESPFNGYGAVVVNVPPVEPSTKIVSEFDFSQSEYDLIRSMPNEDPLLSALLKGYTYNASFDDVNDEISWVNGYGSWSPNLYLEPFKNYDIEVDMGVFDTTTTLSGTKQIIGLCKDGTNGLRFCWNVSNGYFQIINDSGTVNLSTLTDLAIISNAKILIKTRWSVSTINYDPVCNVTLILNRDNPNSEEISFGRLDKDYAYELRVGRITSQNGIFPYSIKKCKITENKWTPSI